MAAAAATATEMVVVVANRTYVPPSSFAVLRCSSYLDRSFLLVQQPSRFVRSSSFLPSRLVLSARSASRFSSSSECPLARAPCGRVSEEGGTALWFGTRHLATTAAIFSYERGQLLTGTTVFLSSFCHSPFPLFPPPLFFSLSLLPRGSLVLRAVPSSRAIYRFTGGALNASDR